jgi:serine/threonine-protein kinase HipA
MARLEVRYETGDQSHVVGHLLTAQRTIYFQYATPFAALGIELSPFMLPLTRVEPVVEATRTYAGLHGLFNDSLPDGWGMLIMERALRARGIDPTLITPLDRLAYIGSRGMGALTYHPPTHGEDEAALALDLSEIAEQSERILAGSAEDILPELVRAAGSAMGARPKVVAGVRADFGALVTGTADLPPGHSHWLIKFAAKEDPADVGPIEAAYADMARAAGITVPPTHLFAARDGRSYFGVERFDRDPAAPARRHHVHTFAGLVHHDHRVPGQDYEDLLKVTRLLTRNHQDVVEAFRRMVFNVLAHNRDDHTKNFAFQMDADGTWRLAPAYDVTYSAGPGGEHTLMVAGEGRAPTRAHVDAVAAAASLEGREVRAVLDEVQEAVARWGDFAAHAGVSAASALEVQRRLVAVRTTLNDPNGVETVKAAARARGRVARGRRRERDG